MSSPCQHIKHKYSNKTSILGVTVECGFQALMNRTVKMKSTVFRYLFFNCAGFSKQSLQCKVLYIPISVGIKKWGGSLGVYPRPKHSPHQNHPATVTPPQPTEPPQSPRHNPLDARLLNCRSHPIAKTDKSTYGSGRSVSVCAIAQTPH